MMAAIAPEQSEWYTLFYPAPFSLSKQRLGQAATKQLTRALPSPPRNKPKLHPLNDFINEIPRVASIRKQRCLTKVSVAI
jgi:hypothetical protein